MPSGADERFLRLACLSYAADDDASAADAEAMLAADPDLPSRSLAAASVCGRADLVRHFLTTEPGTATQRTAPHGWPPLMYLAYGRIDSGEDATLHTARLLLDAGADPNDGRLSDGLPTPFTVLTGVFGGGERDQSAHPHALSLGRLLLERGAMANDEQTVYNRMFSDDDDVFELLFAWGLRPGTVTRLLSWAVDHDQRSRVSMLARHGVDITAPLSTGKTPLETALLNGNGQLAAQLRSLGATAATLDPVETFVAAVLSGDAAAVEATPAAVLAAARAARPSLAVWAAGQRRPAAVRLAVAAGFDVNARGRSDIPSEQEWQTPLHTAVENDDPVMVRLLLDLGADPSVRDARFDGTPLDWAEHLGHRELAELLSAWPGP